MNSTNNRVAQKGSALIEAMVAVLVFSFGILALVSMQTASVRSTSDAKYRADASFLANQIIGQMWGVDLATRGNFANGPAVGGAACPTGATAATAGAATAWLDEVSKLLPGADANRQQITLDGDVVTVRVCWLDRSASVAAYHNHVVTAQIHL